MNKKVIGAMLLCSLLFNPVAHAAPTSSSLSNQRAQLENARKSYASIIDSIEEIESRVETTENQIGELSDELAKVNADIADMQAKANALDAEIKTQTATVGYYQEMIRKKVIGGYMNSTGDVGEFIKILLDSSDINDFSIRLQAINKIISNDTQNLEKYKALKAQLEQNKKDLDVKRASLDETRKVMESKKASLDSAKARQAEQLASLKKKRSTYEKEIRAYEDLVNKTLSQLSSSSVSRGASGTVISHGSFTNMDVVNYALSFRGVPYLWGGTTPAGFDCSGLMQYVYRHYGVEISRTTSTQIKRGVSVSKSQLIPGDLVFFGSNGVTEHVGMYIGDGYFVHAPHTGDVVKISSLSSRTNYMGARRYLN